MSYDFDGRTSNSGCVRTFVVIGGHLNSRPRCHRANEEKQGSTRREATEGGAPAARAEEISRVAAHRRHEEQGPAGATQMPQWEATQMLGWGRQQGCPHRGFVRHNKEEVQDGQPQSVPSPGRPRKHPGQRDAPRAAICDDEHTSVGTRTNLVSKAMVTNPRRGACLDGGLGRVASHRRLEASGPAGATQLPLRQ